MSAETDREEAERGDQTEQGGGSTFSPKRRQVLSGLGGAGLAAAFGIGNASGSASAAPDEGTQTMESEKMRERMNETYRIRREIAEKVRDRPMPTHESVDFDEEYATKIASYTKGLPHNDQGEVEVDAYIQLVEALETGDPEKFEELTMGGGRGLISPQAALCTELLGEDPHMMEMPMPPEFDSDQQIAEAVEVYWQSLTRDVPFRKYEDSELVSEAIGDLSGAPGFGKLTPQTIFRTELEGVDEGPYISQFLWKTPALGVHDIEQQITTLEPGVDYITDYDEWLANMRGEEPNVQKEDGEEVAANLARADEHLFTDEKRYMCTGRDLAACVQRDMVYQPFMIAALVLTGRPVDGVVPNPEEIYDSSHPYANSETQISFVNHGRAGVMDMVASVAQMAHSAAWFQKWAVHRRCRPEKFGGLVEATLNDEIDADHGVPIEKLCEYDVLDRVHEENGSYVLTSAFPEGAPTHPAYPGGHATVSGACVTVLKAVFNEDYAIPNPVQATADGSELEDWEGEELTVGGELNKLAMNVNVGGRQFAGVHYRSDHEPAFRLGEEIAVSFLEDCKKRFNEKFDGWSFTSFDGETVHIE